ncbi:YcdB/YcdC domain-containing protein [Caldalkalibacillus mannanilyticus]|uniref:YcdB/YcdC domain-containing protein n=1 Tax=Caldalkalibacillus mannanilyticus TaxID=1418 RepID=UPI00046A8B33|nr:YcdB/YcdC domain-containing protein [Caldalkalibacillus mannanilyticus]
MSIHYDTLRKIAQEIITIPQHFQLEMEDSIPIGDEKERAFVWEVPGTDEKIEICLDLNTGQLTRLEIEREQEEERKTDAMEKEIRAVTDPFLKKHAPNHAAYKWVEIEKQNGIYHICYQEAVGGLPLPNTGCSFELDKELQIIRYRLEEYHQPTERPTWPAQIVEKENVLQKIQSEMRTELAFVTLWPSIYEIEGQESEERLVYLPTPSHRWMDAVTGEDLFGMDHYLMPPSAPIESKQEGQIDQHIDSIQQRADWEKRLGIDARQHTVWKSKDDGETLSFLYRQQGKDNDTEELEALSVEGYMKRKFGNMLRNLEASYMFQIEKSTGRLLGFSRGGEEEERTPSFTRKKCWEKAESFLQAVFPDFRSYLWLREDKEDTEDEAREVEFFYLPVYLNGVPVESESVTIRVSTFTGEITWYNGVSYAKLCQLQTHSSTPVLTAEEALARYAEHLSVSLEWFHDLDVEPHTYRLVYKMSLGERSDGAEKKQRELRYIDACSGEGIWNRKE